MKILPGIQKRVEGAKELDCSQAKIDINVYGLVMQMMRMRTQCILFGDRRLDRDDGDDGEDEDDDGDDDDDDEDQDEDEDAVYLVRGQKTRP